MQYAKRVDGADRILATPGAQGVCPSCDAVLLAKCGEIVVWHWAHVARGREDCDPWSEGETVWHRDWKRRAPADCVEVVMGAHRADIKIGGRVIELQHSALSPAAIREREQFYPDLLWVWDATAAFRGQRLALRDRGGYVTFTWTFPRQSLAACRQPVWLDLGDRLLAVKKLYPGGTLRGWGAVLSQAAFVQRFLQPFETDPAALARRFARGADTAHNAAPKRRASGGVIAW
jgi:hypothetical protein